MKAMILAAGLGTRLRPLTNTIPKALIEVNGVPLLERVIRRLQADGFCKIIINVHYLADRIIDFLSNKRNFGIDLQISDETGKLLDTGGGLRHAAWFFDDNEPFLVHNVDILSDLNLRAFYETHRHSHALATLAVKHRQSSRYFLFNHDQLLCGWQNTKTGERRVTRVANEEALTPLAFSGIHVLHPAILERMPDQEVFSMTDLYIQLAAQHPIRAFLHDDSWWMGVGEIEQLREAEQWLRAQET